MALQDALNELADRVRQEAERIQKSEAVVQAASEKLSVARKELGIKNREEFKLALDLSGARGSVRLLLFGDRESTIPIMEKAFGRNFFPSWNGEFQSIEIKIEGEDV